MKLIRLGEERNVEPGLQLTNGTRVDVSAFGEGYSLALRSGALI